MDLVILLSHKLKEILMSDGILYFEGILDFECKRGEALYKRTSLDLGFLPLESNIKPTVCQGVCRGVYCGLEKTKPLDSHLCPIGERPGYPLNTQKPSRRDGKIPEFALLSLTYKPMFLKKRGNPWN